MSSERGDGGEGKGRSCTWIGGRGVLISILLSESSACTGSDHSRDTAALPRADKPPREPALCCRWWVEQGSDCSRTLCMSVSLARLADCQPPLAALLSWPARLVLAASDRGVANAMVKPSSSPHPPPDTAVEELR